MPDLPWDFVVQGVPASVQGSKRFRARWKAQVAAAASVTWLDPPLDGEVLVRLTYFHDSAPLDVDNMIKPIQDALIGVVYQDDKQVVQVVSGRLNLNERFNVRGLSQALANGFVSDGPFVHIRIEPPPDPQELP